MDKESLLRFLHRHFFGILGALLGLVLAILLFTIGLWKTLLLVLLVGLGLYLGWKIDSKGSIKSAIHRVLGEDRDD